MPYSEHRVEELQEISPIRISNIEAYSSPKALHGNIGTGDSIPNISVDTSSVGIGKSYSAMNGFLARHRTQNGHLPLHRHRREVMFFIAPLKNQLGYSNAYIQEAAQSHLQVLNLRSKTDITPEALGKICAYTPQADGGPLMAWLMTNDMCYDIISAEKFYEDLAHEGSHFKPIVARRIKNNNLASRNIEIPEGEDENEVIEYINTCYESGRNIRNRYLANINSDDEKVRNNAFNILRSDVRSFSSFLLWGFFYNCPSEGADITLKPVNEILDIIYHPMYADAMNFLRFAAPLEMAKFQTSIIFMTLDKARLSISVDTIKTRKDGSKSHISALCYDNLFSFVNNLKKYSPEVDSALLAEGAHDRLQEGDEELRGIAQSVIKKVAIKSKSKHLFEAEGIPFTIFIDEEHDVCSRLSQKNITTLVGHTDEEEHQDGAANKVEGLLSLAANAFRVMQKIENERSLSGCVQQYRDAVERRAKGQGDGYDEMDAALFKISKQFRILARRHLPELFDDQRACIDRMVNWFTGADHRGFTAISSDVETFKSIVGNSLNLGLTTIVGSNNLKSLFIDFEADGAGVRTYRITKNVRGAESLSMHNFIIIIMLYYKAAAMVSCNINKIKNRYENQDDVLVSFLRNVSKKKNLLKNVFNEVLEGRLEINEFFTYFTYKVIPTLSVVNAHKEKSADYRKIMPDIMHIGLGLSIIGCPAELDVFRAIYDKNGNSKNIVSVASATRGLHGAYATKLNLQNFFNFINETMETSISTILDVSLYNSGELQTLAELRYQRMLGGLELSRVKISGDAVDKTTYRMREFGEMDRTPERTQAALQPSDNVRTFSTVAGFRNTSKDYRTLRHNGKPVFSSNRQRRETQRCFDFLKIIEAEEKDALIFTNSNAPLRALGAIASMNKPLPFRQSGAFMYTKKPSGFEIANFEDFEEYSDPDYVEDNYAEDLGHFKCVVDKLQDINKQKVAFIPRGNGKSILLICFDSKLGEDIEFSKLVRKHHERQNIVIISSHVSGGVGLNNVVTEFGGDYSQGYVARYPEDHLRPEDEEILFGITKDFQILAISSSNYYSAVRVPGIGYNNRENFNVAFRKLADFEFVPTMGDVANGLESKIILDELKKENITSLVSTIIQTIGRFERRNHTQTKAIVYLDDEESKVMRDSAFEGDMMNLARFYASNPDAADQYISMASVCTRGLFAMASVFAERRTLNNETLGYLKDEGSYCEKVRKDSIEFFGNDNENERSFRYLQMRARANDPRFSWVPDFNDTLRSCTTPDSLKNLKAVWHRKPGYPHAVAMGYGDITDNILSHMFYDLDIAEGDTGFFFGLPELKGKTIFINYETGRLSDLRDDKADIFDSEAVYSFTNDIPIILNGAGVRDFENRNNNFRVRNKENDSAFKERISQRLKEYIDSNSLTNPNPWIIPTLDMRKNIRGNIGEKITSAVLKEYIDNVSAYHDIPGNRFMQLDTFLKKQADNGRADAVLKFRNLSFEYADLALIDTETCNILAIDAKNIFRLNDEILRSLSEGNVFDKKQKFQAAFSECFGACDMEYAVINAAMSAIELNDVNHVFTRQSSDTGIYRYSLFSIVEMNEKRRCNGISTPLHNKIVEFMGVSPLPASDDFYSLED